MVQHVSESNIGRQRFTAADIGKNKATLLCHRINLFYGLEWSAMGVAHDPANCRNVDLLITAVDKASYRARLAAHWKNKQTNTVWLDSGNGATEGQVLLAHLGKPADRSARLPNIIDLYPEVAEQAERLDADGPSCSLAEAISRQQWPVNRMAAQLAVDLLWQLIRTGSIAQHGYRFTVSPVDVVPMPICETSWAMLGYAPARRRTSRAPKRRTA